MKRSNKRQSWKIGSNTTLDTRCHGNTCASIGRQWDVFKSLVMEERYGESFVSTENNIGLLEWIAVPLSRGFSQPRDRTQVSLIAGRFFIS